MEEKAKAIDKFRIADATNITTLTDYVTDKTGVNATDSTLYFMFDKLVSEVSTTMYILKFTDVVLTKIQD